jgi:hypothetical protein
VQNCSPIAAVTPELASRHVKNKAIANDPCKSLWFLTTRDWVITHCFTSVLSLISRLSHHGLLRARREQPCRRATEQRHELAAFHAWMAPAWQEISSRAAEKSLAVMCPACSPSPAGPMESANRECRRGPSPHHSMTSSAATCSVRGTSRPSAFAVNRLITNSNLFSWFTGRADGLSPFKIFPAYMPAS